MTLGITGISGSGKHTAAQFFKKRDWVVLDVDKMAHHSYRPYTNVWKRVVREFGEGILNQNDTINRIKLGKIVFNASEPDGSQKALKKLNKIIHPYVKRQVKSEIHHYFRRKSNIIVLAALWDEIGMEEFCDKILLITANPDSANKRIQKRDSISPETYQMRVKNQTIPPNPDFTVENNGTIDEFHSQLAQISL